MKPTRLFYALLLTLASPCVQAELRLVKGSPQRLNATEPLKLEFSAPVAGHNLVYIVRPRDNPGRVIDVGALATASDREVTLALAPLGMRGGMYELSVLALDLQGNPKLLGKLELENGSEPKTGRKSEVGLKLDVSTKPQVSEKVSGSQAASQRPHQADLATQGTVSGEFAGQDWEVKAQLQLAGSSYRPQAVAYGTQGVRAPKLDLPAYVIEGGWRSTRFNAGHISVDMNPLVYSGIGNRGVSLQHQFLPGWDFGFAAQTTAYLSGIRNFFGLSQNENQHRSIGTGVDLLPAQPGRMRLDLTATETRQQTSRDQVRPDRSSGTGARFIWRNEANTLRTEAVVASSDYETTGIGGGVPAGKGRARTLEVGYDVLKDHAWREGLPLSLRLAARSEYASPSFRSLGSSFGANYQMDIATTTMRMGPATLQGQLARRHDNVDGNATYMRNRVQASALNLQLPLAEVMPALRPKAAPTSDKPADAATPTQWWPTFSVTRQTTHGFGDPGYIPAGYFIEDLPNVFVVNEAMGLGWQFEKVTLNVRSERTAQDNRQVGQEGQSTRDRKHSISLDWRPLTSLSVSLAYDPSLNYRFDQNVRNNARQLRGSVNWTPAEKWQVALDLNHSSDHDTLDTRYNRLNTTQLQVTRRFEVAGPGGRKLPGQAFVRLSENRGFNFSAGSPVLEPGVRRVQMGVTLSLF